MFVCKIQQQCLFIYIHNIKMLDDLIATHAYFFKLEVIKDLFTWRWYFNILNTNRQIELLIMLITSCWLDPVNLKEIWAYLLIKLRLSVDWALKEQVNLPWNIEI